MSTALGYVFLLLPVAAVIYIVWRYRRAAVDKEMRRREREAALFELMREPPAAPVAPVTPVAATAVPAAVAPPASAVPTAKPVAGAPAASTAATAAFPAVATAHAPPAAHPVAPDTAPAAAPATAPGVTAGERRERFLSHSETLIYFLLRTGMPEHEVFPRATLASVVANFPPAAGRSTTGAASNAHELDFVVCDRRMRIVAAVQVAGRLAEPEQRRVEEGLAAAGIRLVTVDLKALPKRDELKARVLGRADEPSVRLSDQ